MNKHIISRCLVLGSVLVLVLVVFMKIRLEVAYSIKKQQLAIASAEAIANIDAGNFEIWREPYLEYAEISLHEIMWNPTKWTREQVYGKTTKGK